MADGYQFGWDTIVFPAPTNSTLATLDPVTQTILRYYENILQINLGNAFNADATTCGLTGSVNNNIVTGSVVAQAVGFPVDSLLQTTKLKFPLLSVYRLTRKFEQHSSLKLMIHSNYVVNFVLPPLAVEQYNLMYKYLSAVSDVLVQRTWQGSDANYNNGELVWKTANFAYAMLDGDEYGSFLGNDGKTEFPSIRFMLTVMEESQFVLSNYEEMTGVDVEVDNVDGYNLSLPYKNIADGYINPNLDLVSLDLSSGSVNGGTIVVLTGTAFSNIQTSFTSTQNLMFNGAPAAKLVVKSDSIVLAVTGPGPTTGTGDVVLTDSLGNTTTLINGWTYN
jgi:hypothetical protein